MKTQAMQDRLATVGIVAGDMTQPEFVRFVANQIDTVGGMVKSMGIRND